MPPKTISAAAPATVANVGCGFDILGFALTGPHDVVTASLSEQPGVRITGIEGDHGKLPLAADRNTAGVAATALLTALGKQNVGVDLQIKKGLPIGSGIGSSAASAVAATVAVNQLLGNPFSRRELLPFAMAGEAVAAGVAHPDNVAPALLGGLLLIRGENTPDVVALKTPPDLWCTLVCPEIEIRTAEARQLLPESIPLRDAVRQWGNIAGFVAGLFSADYELIRRSFEDHIVAPRRSVLIPGFSEIVEAALNAGALGCSLSGSGPAMFALCRGARTAENAAAAMQATVARSGIACSSYTSRLDGPGAEITVIR